MGFDFVRVHLNERTEIPVRYWTVVALEKVVDHGFPVGLNAVGQGVGMRQIGKIRRIRHDLV